MNRRKAIGCILAAGAAGAAVFSGYTWHDWHKTPDVAYLEGRRDAIAALAETIIPAGDTPGAIEAGAHDFIIKMIRDCTDPLNANKFIDGLKELDRYCRSKYDKAYEACSKDEQVSILQHFEQKGKSYGGVLGKIQNKYTGGSFFSILKDYTVRGYCTSEPGMTRGLAYVPVPGSYHGCIPLTPGQRSWATA